MTLYDFYERYININLKDYTNIGIDFEISKIIVILTFGVIAVTTVIGYRRACILTLLNGLIDSGATEEGRAKTLSEMNIKSLGIRRILSGRTLSDIVTVKRNSESKNGKIDFEQDSFYIKKENMSKAEHILLKTAPTLVRSVLFCVLIIMISICIILIIPEILTSVNSVLEL